MLPSLHGPVEAMSHHSPKMKLLAPTTILAATLALAMVGATGCRSKRPDKNITPIPGVGSVDPQAGSFGGPIGDGGIIVAPELGDGIGIAGQPSGVEFAPIGTEDLNPIAEPLPPVSSDMSDALLEREGEYLLDTDAFSANTVNFGYDSSVVGSAEIVKLDEIIQILSSDYSFALKIEGHCDERGTEEYNRSLGERRANSVRDHLMSAGIGPDRIRTLSYGAEKPKDFGHDEVAWAENRRAEFILMRPAR